MSRDPGHPRSENTLVYSTAAGRHCGACGRTAARCSCRSGAKPKPPSTRDPGDGKVRVRRETKGRKGKTMTTVSGLSLPERELRELFAELKRMCGSGGALKQGVLEIQGDHAERLVAELARRGFRSIRAGG